MAERLLTLPAVADIYDVCPRTIRRMLKRGDDTLPLPVRTKPRFKWRQSDIDARLRRLSLVDELKGERDARA
ncbi:MAG: helix-turn-helix domain-containing protein [Candidatus Eisenbacteria bacterium]|nr:helix-turn-helix domain-containing protein [Candidatus Eisenbacteria bacterium]